MTRNTNSIGHTSQLGADSTDTDTYFTKLSKVTFKFTIITKPLPEDNHNVPLTWSTLSYTDKGTGVFVPHLHDLCVAKIAVNAATTYSVYHNHVDCTFITGSSKHLHR